MPQEFAFPDREARAWTAWSVPPGGGAEWRACRRHLPGGCATARWRDAGASGRRSDVTRARRSRHGRRWPRRCSARSARSTSPSCRSSRRSPPTSARRSSSARGRCAAVDHRDGQCRQPAARARDNAAARDGTARGDRRRAAAHRQAIADRERDHRTVRRRRGTGACRGTATIAAVAAAGRVSAPRRRGHRSARAAVYAGGVVRRECRLRPAARVACLGV